MPSDQQGLEAARAAKSKAVRLLRSNTGVNGIGITRLEGVYAVRVNLERECDPGELPTEIDGVPVVIRVVGQIHKQNQSG